MVKFKVGDHVKVVSARFGNTPHTYGSPRPQIGMRGIVVSMHGHDYPGLPIYVEFTPEYANSYDHSDLEFVEPPQQQINRDHADYYLAITGDTDGQV